MAIDFSTLTPKPSLNTASMISTSANHAENVVGYDGVSRTKMNKQGFAETFEEKIITFTCLTNKNGLLTKKIRPDGSGGIIKDTAAHLFQGISETMSIPFSAVGQFLRSLQPDQAICQGVCDYNRAEIVTLANHNNLPGIVTRSKKFFRYPEEWGLGMFDHDPKPGQKSLSAEEFISIICNIWPEFQCLPTWWTPSTSAYIYDMQGNPLTGNGDGWHLYFPFNPANKLPELANWLFKKLWIAGYGYIFISRSGSLLERTIFDAAVFSPERLIFEAGAQCTDCVQRLPEPVFRPGQLWRPQ